MATCDNPKLFELSQDESAQLECAQSSFLTLTLTQAYDPCQLWASQCLRTNRTNS